MKTIALVGLGNIGTHYAMTRHNAGFLCLNALTELCNGAHNPKEILNLENTKNLFGNLEKQIGRKSTQGFQWIEQKNLQSYTARLPLKDFVSILANYPQFLAQWKFLRPHKRANEDKKDTKEKSLLANFYTALQSFPNDYEILCIAPTTFMNRSGTALQKIAKCYNITHTIIIYDDLDTRFGNLGFKERGGSGGHNGLKSIHEYFSDEYMRVKIGIGSNAFLQEDFMYKNNEIKNTMESMRNLFLETFEERINFAPIFKTKSFFKILHEKAEKAGLQAELFTESMRAFHSLQKSGTKEVADYVLSPFHARECEILPALLAYSALSVVGIIFERIYTLHNMLQQDSLGDTKTTQIQPLSAYNAFGIQMK